MNPATHEPITFTCIDCSIQVYAFGYVHQTLRCATCEWISSLPTPEEQEKLRAFLTENEQSK